MLTDGHHEDVDPEVEFEAIDEKRLVQVPLGYHRRLGVHFPPIAAQKDAFTLATPHGFYNEGGLQASSVCGLHVRSKVAESFGQHKGRGSEVEVFRKGLRHSTNAFRQISLLTNQEHAWEVVSTLGGGQFRDASS